MTRVPVVLLAVASWLALPTGAGAQAGAAVTGSVVDTSGAVLPGANVTLTGAGPSHYANTGPDGHFHLQNVNPGTYKLTVSLAGFQASVRDGVQITGGPQDLPAITLQVATRGEDIVVSASKVESTVLNAPVSVSVIGADTLSTSPAQNYGDILRQVPGLNVIQMSARDINVTSRESTNTLSNTQLALLDGRSIYLDFFGLILWDFVPTNTSDIKQIEVVRGPASAVWGANALTGVVNIITKTPREAAGGSITLTGGGFSRDAGDTVSKGTGSDYGGNISWAAAPNDQWSYKLTGGYFFSDAFPRPTGRVPIAENPADPGVPTGGAPYPPFPNQGTKQPKFSARVDQELGNGGRMTYDAGVAGTRGIIHTGIGPFDIQNGSYLAYGKVGYTKGGLKVNGFANFVDTKAPNLLAVDPLTGKPLQLNFKTQTYDFEVGNSNVVGAHNIVTYGGNARRNNFDITITPAGQNRNEFGAYVQDEVLFDQVRFTLGGRVDKFGNLDKAVFSPRLAAVFKPTPSQSLRVSFNKAFRSPSLINNYLDIRLVAALVDLSPLAPFLPPPFRPAVEQPFPLVAHAVGSEVRRGVDPTEPPLREEVIKAYEVGYTGTFGGNTTVEAAFYINDHDDSINFITSPTIQISQNISGALYTAQNPPPGWPLPPSLIPLLGQQFGIFFPAQFTYLNLGPYRQKGVELSLDHTFSKGVSGFANYSYQADPTVKDSPTPFPKSKLAFPPKNRFNVGVSYNDRRFLGSASVNYSDKAFWTDVLGAQFNGFTDSFTMLNASFGVKWADGRLTTSIKGTNLANSTIQQHVFGDLIKRSVYGEVRYTF